MEPSMPDDEPITDAEQRRAASLMRLTEEITAPPSLHAAVAGMTASGTAAPARRRPWLLAPAGLVAAVVVIAIVVGVAGGGGDPTVGQTARLALAPATAPAPAPDVSDRRLLSVRAAGIPFPSYLRSDGWTPSGVRHDTLHGRAVTTVFYRSGSRRVGYAIVGGRALAYPRGMSTTAGGVRYVLSRADGARLVTWWRSGHTCVIAGRAVPDATLLALARTDERTT
jgi:hypothetical protein